jgi:hypothetical protein
VDDVAQDPQKRIVLFIGSHGTLAISGSSYFHNHKQLLSELDLAVSVLVHEVFGETSTTRWYRVGGYFPGSACC